MRSKKITVLVASLLAPTCLAALAQGGMIPTNLTPSAPLLPGAAGPLSPNFKQYTDQQQYQNAYHFLLQLQTDNPKDINVQAAVKDLQTKATDKASMYGLIRKQQKSPVY